jgi:hypothetical protein
MSTRDATGEAGGVNNLSVPRGPLELSNEKGTDSQSHRSRPMCRQILFLISSPPKSETRCTCQLILHRDTRVSNPLGKDWRMGISLLGAESQARNNRVRVGLTSHGKPTQG